MAKLEFKTVFNYCRHRIVLEPHSQQQQQQQPSTTTVFIIILVLLWVANVQCHAAHAKRPFYNYSRAKKIPSTGQTHFAAVHLQRYATLYHHETSSSVRDRSA